MTTSDNTSIFDKIYNNNEWYFGSGSGSVAIFNKPFISFVNKFLKEHPEVKTVIDLGCGDWQIAKHFELGDRKYIGCDVSKFIIEKTRAKYATPARLFLHFDAVKNELPSGDLIIVKDVLQHLSNIDVVKIISKLNGCRYVIISNSFHDWITTNKEIVNRKPPFNASQYFLVEEYVETLLKPINLAHQLLFLPKIKKGIFTNHWRA